MTPDRMIDIKAASRMVHVDDRIDLRHYLRVANGLLDLASVFREEKNIIDLYIVLLRFSSLVTETMPFHRDYKTWCSKEKAALKKKLLNALVELESLKPEVQRRVSGVNRGQATTNFYQPNDPRIPYAAEASSSNVDNTSLRLEIKQGRHSTVAFDTQASVTPATAPPTDEDREMSMAISASLQSFAAERSPLAGTNSSSGAYASSGESNFLNTNSFNSQGSAGAPALSEGSSIACEVQEADSSGNTAPSILNEDDFPAVDQGPTQTTAAVSVPSAPPIENLTIDGLPFNSPSVYSTPVSSPSRREERKEDADTPSCIICFDAPIQGACVPCGHMAGCMSCLNEIRTKNWDCPVCREKVDLVIRLYTV